MLNEYSNSKLKINHNYTQELLIRIVTLSLRFITLMTRQIMKNNSLNVISNLYFA